MDYDLNDGEFHPFTLLTIESSVPDEPGIYGFKYRNYFVYIGQSTNLRARLKKYWNNTSHSDGLHLWLKAKKTDMKITFKTYETADRISTMEKYFIKIYQPKANQLLK